MAVILTVGCTYFVVKIDTWVRSCCSLYWHCVSMHTGGEMVWSFVTGFSNGEFVDTTSDLEVSDDGSVVVVG